MFRQSKIIIALVIGCLLVTSIYIVKVEASTFDNSDFVSEMTSEEKEQEAQALIEEDYQKYQENQELQVKYSNFEGYNYYPDQETFDAEMAAAYNAMSKNLDYDEEQKDAYYNAYIGSESAPGLMRYMYEFSKIIAPYQTDETVVVDCTQALAILENTAMPKLGINNIEYMQALSRLLNELGNSFEVKQVSSLSPDELAAAQLSNVLFTKQIGAIYSQVPYLSMPNTPLLKRVMHNEVLFNIALLVGMIVLFVVRFPIIKKQQLYAWNRFRPITFLVIPAVGLFFYIFFTWFFSVPYTVEETNYSIYLDGQPVTTANRIYQNMPAKYTVSLVAPGSEFTVSSASFDVIVSDDPNQAATRGDLATTKFGELGAMKFSTTTGTNQVILPVSDDEYTYTSLNTIIQSIGIEATDNYEPDELGLSHYIDYNRNEFILPMKLRLVIPSLMFGVLYFMFIMMPKPMVKMYLNELYTINKFCGFLSYNMAYRSNARVLIEETLQSLEACKFAEDFAIIFFEKERDMTDKIQDISQIYSYKFFEMYLGIVNIIFDEGVSESTLKSLSIIQQFGDEYYNQADMFFKSKKGAMSALMMIIAICVALPAIVKNSVGEFFSLYMTVPNGYTMTIGCYLIWFGLVCVINNMYKNNKIVRAEGRYV